jgi:hypothetical protein
MTENDVIVGDGGGRTLLGLRSPLLSQTTAAVTRSCLICRNTFSRRSSSASRRKRAASLGATFVPPSSAGRDAASSPTRPASSAATLLDTDRQLLLSAMLKISAAVIANFELNAVLNQVTTWCDLECVSRNLIIATVSYN